MKSGALLKLLRRHVDEEDKAANVLSNEQRVFLASALAKFVTHATEKFIIGQKEHGGDITDRHLVAELQRELIDAWFYSEGIKKKGESL